ncbi:hypothetical protein [Streptomyces sp. NPDC047108]|uniref:hypothetical protein n=1 Tax=Streptomyces sp. NPDC047108 TaxID=3155025 RepID=UPI00340F057B
MGDGYQQASAETRRRWGMLAEDVSTELAAAGLPVVPGMDARVSAGVRVAIDPGSDASGGVYVEWRIHPWLASAITRCTLQHQAEAPVVRYGAHVADVMREAIRQILTTGGFTVHESPNELVAHMLYVAAGPRGTLSERLRLG